MVMKEVVRVSVTVLKLNDSVNPEYTYYYTLCTYNFYDTLLKCLNHDLFFDFGLRDSFEILHIDFIN